MAEKRRPWGKWFWGDWRKDARLRRCSFAARGLWADLLSLMGGECEPFGFLIMEGQPLDSEDLVGLLGGSAREISRLLSELEAKGVFTRVGYTSIPDDIRSEIPSGLPERTIFSRRMVRDMIKEREDRKNGKGGGNPILKGGVNPKDKAHMPDARSQIPEKKESTAAAKAASLPLPFEFPTWWPKDAWDGFVAMRKKIRAPLTERAIAGLVAELGRLRADGGDPVAILDQSTQRAWRGIFPVKPDAKFGVIDGGGGIEHSSVVGWVTRLEIFHGLVEDSKVGSWLAKWGPPPGAAGCLVPKESLEVFQRRHPSKTARPAP